MGIRDVQRTTHWGDVIGAAYTTCERCGAKRRSLESRFCSRCGLPLPSEQVLRALWYASRTVTTLGGLAVLVGFFGFLWIHRSALWEMVKWFWEPTWS